MEKKTIKKFVKVATLSASVLALLSGCVSCAYDSEYGISKVETDLTYYGGSTDNISTNLFGTCVNHLDMGDNSNIVVGYDSSVSVDTAVQFNYFIDYLNAIYDIINPNYHFYVTENATKDNCDILISFISFKEEQPEKYENNVAAYVQRVINSSTGKIYQADVYFDGNRKFNNPQLRYILAHEFYHSLTGIDDIPLDDEMPMTVTSYWPLYHIISHLNIRLDESQKDLKDSFVCYMPYDLSALIAIYGDSTTVENKQKYLNLLNNTYDVCYEIFGDENPFYRDSYVLPKYASSTSTLNENTIYVAPKERLAQSEDANEFE